MKTPVFDDLIERLKELDAEASVETPQSSELARIVVAKRRRHQAVRRATRIAGVTVLVLSGVLILSNSVRQPVTDDKGQGIEMKTAARNVKDPAADSIDIRRVQQELQNLRKQSSQVQHLITQLDEVNEQRNILDRVIRELEQRRLEQVIRTEISESLAITTSYDFGY